MKHPRRDDPGAALPSDCSEDERVSDRKKGREAQQEELPILIAGSRIERGHRCVRYQPEYMPGKVSAEGMPGFLVSQNVRSIHN